MKGKKKIIGLVIYFILLLLPIYWMLNMSLRSNADILASFALYPKDLTFMNYMKIFTDSTWYMGYVNSFIYVAMNTVISLFVALPAAYAFSRYKFVCHTRMKRSGAWWVKETGNAMLRIRCAIYNGTYEKVFEKYKKKQIPP